MSLYSSSSTSTSNPLISSKQDVSKSSSFIDDAVESPATATSSAFAYLRSFFMQSKPKSTAKGVEKKEITESKVNDAIEPPPSPSQSQQQQPSTPSNPINPNTNLKTSKPTLSSTKSKRTSKYKGANFRSNDLVEPRPVKYKRRPGLIKVVDDKLLSIMEIISSHRTARTFIQLLDYIDTYHSKFNADEFRECWSAFCIAQQERETIADDVRFKDFLNQTIVRMQANEVDFLRDRFIGVIKYALTMLNLPNVREGILKLAKDVKANGVSDLNEYNVKQNTPPSSSSSSSSPLKPKPSLFPHNLLQQHAENREIVKQMMLLKSLRDYTSLIAFISTNLESGVEDEGGQILNNVSLLSLSWKLLSSATPSESEIIKDDVRFKEFTQRTLIIMKETDGFLTSGLYSSVIQCISKLGCTSDTVSLIISLGIANAQNIISSGTCKSISITIRSFACLGHYSSEMLNVVGSSEVVEKLVREGKLNDITNTLWSFARLRYACPQLFELVSCKLEGIIKKQNLERRRLKVEVSDDSVLINKIIWTFETMNYPLSKFLVDWKGRLMESSVASDSDESGSERVR